MWSHYQGLWASKRNFNSYPHLPSLLTLSLLGNQTKFGIIVSSNVFKQSCHDKFPQYQEFMELFSIPVLQGFVIFKSPLSSSLWSQNYFLTFLVLFMQNVNYAALNLRLFSLPSYTYCTFIKKKLLLLPLRALSNNIQKQVILSNTIPYYIWYDCIEVWSVNLPSTKKDVIVVFDSLFMSVSLPARLYSPEE